MSISSALWIGQSGLTALGKRAEVTSANIANADSPGYVRRDADLISGVGNSGVSANGVTRDVDRALQARQWSEAAGAGYHAEMAKGISFFSDQLGEPDSALSLPSLIADFQTELDLLSVDPGNPIVQASVLRRAEGIVQGIGDAADAIVAGSDRAFGAIETIVSDVNDLSSQIADLNVRIAVSTTNTAERAALQDEQDAAIDKLAQLVDVKVVRRGAEGVDILTTSGASLVEGSSILPVTFDRSTGTLMAGPMDITPGGETSRGLTGGALAADVMLYNTVLPEADRQLDALAAALITSFETADASLAPGQAGLFTDAGVAFDAANIDGIASRITINAAVDPAQGGELSRLRDGIGAATPGALSDGTQVNGFIDALNGLQSFDPALGLGENVTIATYAANFVTSPNLAAVDAERQAEAARTAVLAIQDERSVREGVDIDTEIQNLLAIEQAFAANSQVISALTRMMDDLLEVV